MFINSTPSAPAAPPPLSLPLPPSLPPSPTSLLHLPSKSPSNHPSLPDTNRIVPCYCQVFYLYWCSQYFHLVLSVVVYNIIILFLKHYALELIQVLVVSGHTVCFIESNAGLDPRITRGVGAQWWGQRGGKSSAMFGFRNQIPMLRFRIIVIIYMADATMNQPWQDNNIGGKVW